VDKDSEKELFEQFQAAITANGEKHYSPQVIDRLLNPRNVGTVADPQGVGKKLGVCGDTMELSLRVQEDKVIDAKFLTEGCGFTQVAGSMATELAIGKTVNECFMISPQTIIEQLGGLPEDHEHCALLASDTLREALQDYLARKREPWKHNYRRD
jgi:nitrogen fixation protein NifU and related proteins